MKKKSGIHPIAIAILLAIIAFFLARALVSNWQYNNVINKTSASNNMKSKRVIKLTEDALNQIPKLSNGLSDTSKFPTFEYWCIAATYDGYISSSDTENVGLINEAITFHNVKRWDLPDDTCWGRSQWIHSTKKFNLTGRGIYSLAPLAKAYNIEHFILNNNNLPMNGLTVLKSLESHGQLKRITAKSQLTQDGDISIIDCPFINQKICTF